MVYTRARKCLLAFIGAQANRAEEESNRDRASAHVMHPRPYHQKRQLTMLHAAACSPHWLKCLCHCGTVQRQHRGRWQRDASAYKNAQLGREPPWLWQCMKKHTYMVSPQEMIPGDAPCFQLCRHSMSNNTACLRLYVADLLWKLTLAMKPLLHVILRF